MCVLVQKQPMNDDKETRVHFATLFN